MATALDLERQVHPASRPQPAMSSESGRFALVAGTVFSVAVAALASFDRGPAASAGPAAASMRHAPNEASRQAEDVLVPLSLRAKAGVDDGLVGFAPRAVEEASASSRASILSSWLPPLPRALPLVRAALRRLASPMAGGLLPSQSVGGGRVINFTRELEAQAPGGMAPMIDPLVFDLGGDGAYTSARPARYDLEGNGRRGVLRDVSPSGGVLVFDADGDGISGEHGRELLGDRTDLDGNGSPDGFQDGFEALAGLVARAESKGILPAGGRLDAGALAALERSCGLKIRLGGLNGRSVSLKEAGVREIVLSSAFTTRADDFDGRGNGLGQRAGAYFVRADGSTGAYAEVFLAYNVARLRLVSLAR